MVAAGRANVCWVIANVTLVSVAKIAARACAQFSAANVVSNKKTNGEKSISVISGTRTYISKSLNIFDRSFYFSRKIKWVIYCNPVPF